jgi:hypothetical protein
MGRNDKRRGGNGFSIVKKRMPKSRQMRIKKADFYGPDFRVAAARPKALPMANGQNHPQAAARRDCNQPC